jgi:hypothetical protein
MDIRDLKKKTIRIGERKSWRIKKGGILKDLKISGILKERVAGYLAYRPVKTPLWGINNLIAVAPAGGGMVPV